MILCAAHKVVRVAGESLVMNEMRVHVVITDVPKSDQRHESSVVNVPSRAGQARFRAVALSQRCSFVNGTTRSLVCGALWLPNLCKIGEGQAGCASLLMAHRSHRSRDDGTESSSGRINWGPSAAGGLVPQSGGIIHKPLGGRQRRRCGHSKRRSDRTIKPDGEPRATGLAVVVRSSRCRLDASPTTDQTPGTEIPTVTAYKRARARSRRWPWRQAGLKPYWGKPAVRNFRGGRGNEVDGLMTVCHAARKGRYVGSHWPNHVRASAILDDSARDNPNQAFRSPSAQSVQSAQEVRSEERHALPGGGLRLAAWLALAGILG